MPIILLLCTTHHVQAVCFTLSKGLSLCGYLGKLVGAQWCTYFWYGELICQLNSDWRDTWRVLYSHSMPTPLNPWTQKRSTHMQLCACAWLYKSLPQATEDVHPVGHHVIANGTLINGSFTSELRQRGVDKLSTFYRFFSRFEHISPCSKDPTAISIRSR